MVQFVFFLDAAQDADRIGLGRLRYHHRLEPPRQGGVFFHMLAVFVQRRGRHAMQFAPRQRRFQEVGGVHRALGLAAPDQRVHFVDEENDLARRRGHLGQHRLQPLFELTAIFRARDQRPHIQRHELLARQTFGHIAVDDPQRKPLGDRGFADAGFADQHRVVLGPARKHLHGPADFLVAPDDRIDPALGRRLRQVVCEFLQRLVGIFGAGTVGRAPLAQIIDRAVQGLGVYPARLERIARLRLDHGECGQNPLDRHKGVTGLIGQFLGLGHDLGGRRIEIGLTRVAADIRNFCKRQIIGLGHALGRAAGAADQIGRKTLVIVQKCFQQMLGRKSLVPLAQSDRLGGLHEAARPLGELLQVHRSLLYQAPRIPGARQAAHPSCGLRLEFGMETARYQPASPILPDRLTFAALRRKSRGEGGCP